MGYTWKQIEKLNLDLEIPCIGDISRKVIVSNYDFNIHFTTPIMSTMANKTYTTPITEKVPQDIGSITGIGVPITTTQVNDNVFYGFKSKRYYQTKRRFYLNNWQNSVASYDSTGGTPKEVVIGWINNVHPNGWVFLKVIEMDENNILVVLYNQSANHYVRFVCPTTGTFTTTSAQTITATISNGMKRDSFYYQDYEFDDGIRSYIWVPGTVATFGDNGPAKYVLKPYWGGHDHILTYDVIGGGQPYWPGLWCMESELVEELEGDNGRTTDYTIKTYNNSIVLPPIRIHSEFYIDLGNNHWAKIDNSNFEIIDSLNPNFPTIVTDKGVVYYENNGQYTSRFTIDDWNYDKCELFNCVKTYGWGLRDLFLKVWYVDNEVYLITPLIDQEYVQDEDLWKNFILWKQVPTIGSVSVGDATIGGKTASTKNGYNN